MQSQSCLWVHSLSQHPLSCFNPSLFYFTNFRNSFMFSEFILKFHLEPQSAKAHVDDEIALYQLLASCVNWELYNWHSIWWDPWLSLEEPPWWVDDLLTPFPETLVSVFRLREHNPVDIRVSSLLLSCTFSCKTTPLLQVCFLKRTASPFLVSNLI